MVHISNYRRRIDAVFLFFLLILAYCIARLLFIQLFRSNYLAGMADRQHNLFVELEPRRGIIYDTNLKAQALNISVASVYACPNEMSAKDKEDALRELPSVLKVDRAYLADRLQRKKSFIWLARKISPEQEQAVRTLKLKGIGFIKESKRCYPNGYLASHVLGFAGLDNTGLEGIELSCDRYLKGEAGWAVFLRDARQKKLDLWEKMVLPKDGYDVILTIDEVVQFIAERELDKAYDTFNAKGASIVVMDPHTGAILALANRPTYDLNRHAEANTNQMRNRSVCDLFEPGSVFKIVTLSAALEEGKVMEESRFNCENGAYRFGSHVLHDHRPHGLLTFREVIEQSSNIGTVKVAHILGPQTLYRYIRLFGFGSKSGIDLPGEIPGMVKEPRFWSGTSITAVPIGQEVGVTALQLASAISVIANGGQLMRPYMVRQIRDKHGVAIKTFEPALVRKVISIDTAARAKKVLIGVIENGTGKLAKATGYSAAGKTGTAQKLEANGIYSHSKFVGTFIGFAPAEDPQIAVAVCLDEPHPYYFGGVVAAPVFKNVVNDVLRYLKTKEPLTQARSLNEIYATN